MRVHSSSPHEVTSKPWEFAEELLYGSPYQKPNQTRMT